MMGNVRYVWLRSISWNIIIKRDCWISLTCNSWIHLRETSTASLLIKQFTRDLVINSSSTVQRYFLKPIREQTYGSSITFSLSQSLDFSTPSSISFLPDTAIRFPDLLAHACWILFKENIPQMLSNCLQMLAYCWLYKDRMENCKNTAAMPCGKVVFF